MPALWPIFLQGSSSSDNKKKGGERRVCCPFLPHDKIGYTAVCFLEAQKKKKERRLPQRIGAFADNDNDNHEHGACRKKLGEVSREKWCAKPNKSATKTSHTCTCTSRPSPITIVNTIDTKIKHNHKNSSTSLPPRASGCCPARPGRTTSSPSAGG